MSVATDKERVSTYITTELKEKAERLAERQQRSLSSLIAFLIAEAVEKAEKDSQL